MSNELATRSKEKGNFTDRIEQLVSAIEHSLLVNLVGPDPVRRYVLSGTSKKVRDSQRIYRLDGRIHSYGDVVEAFKSATPIQREESGIVMLDNWSARLVGRGDEESFRRWLESMEPQHHTLILGTKRPLSSTLDKQGQRLFTPQTLAALRIISCDPIVASSEDDQSNSSVPAGAVAAAVATGVGATALWRILEGSKDSRKQPGDRDSTTLKRTLQHVKQGVFGAKEHAKKGTASAPENERPKDTEKVDSDEALEKLVAVTDKEDAKEVMGDLRGSGIGVLKMLRIMGGLKRFRERLEWLSDDERQELVALSSIDLRDYDPDEWTALADFADEARRWGSFLCTLADHDPQIAEESKAFGFELHEDGARRLGIHLTRVGRQPDEFAADLFRASDLIRLFPEFNPDEDKQRDFLRRQFEKWCRDEELEIRQPKKEESTATVTRGVKEFVQSEEPVEFPSVGEDIEGRPVRDLYRLLVELEGSESVKSNLGTIDDYAELKGPTEPRFCEWVYTRMEKRQLLDGLVGNLLLSSDEKKLRKRLGLPPESQECSWPESLREVLTEIGVCEPELPPDLDTGERQLRTAKNYFCHLGTGGGIDAQTYSDEQGLLDGRQGLEKMFQVIVTFLWQGGLNEVMKAVIAEGRQDFDPRRMRNFDVDAYAEQTSVDILEILRTQSAGLLNHLLRAVSAECVAQGVYPPFVRGDKERRELWPDKLYRRIDSLLGSLNSLHHDSVRISKNERQGHRRSLPDKLEKVVRALDDELLRIPRPVQFFRKYDDGHGVHFEGYTSDNQRIWFYEVDRDYDLREPYLFLASTNPAAVDMTCVPLSKVIGG